MLWVFLGTQKLSRRDRESDIEEEIEMRVWFDEGTTAVFTLFSFSSLSIPALSSLCLLYIIFLVGCIRINICIRIVGTLIRCTGSIYFWIRTTNTSRTLCIITSSTCSVTPTHILYLHVRPPHTHIGQHSTQPRRPVSVGVWKVSSRLPSIPKPPTLKDTPVSCPMALKEECGNQLPRAPPPASQR